MSKVKMKEVLAFFNTKNLFSEMDREQASRAGANRGRNSLGKFGF